MWSSKVKISIISRAHCMPVPASFLLDRNVSYSLITVVNAVRRYIAHTTIGRALKEAHD